GPARRRFGGSWVLLRFGGDEFEVDGLRPRPDLDPKWRAEGVGVVGRYPVLLRLTGRRAGVDAGQAAGAGQGGDVVDDHAMVADQGAAAVLPFGAETVAALLVGVAVGGGAAGAEARVGQEGHLDGAQRLAVEADNALHLAERGRLSLRALPFLLLRL